MGNMDETPMWFDLPSNTSIDFKGVKTIRSRTTGKEKLRYTVVLTVLSTGHKLPPMIIFRGLKKPPRGNFGDVVVSASKGGSMTNEFMKSEYLQKVWKARPGSIFKPSCVLTLDTARCHTHEDVKAEFEKEKTRLAYIPGGMTPLLQPLDSHLNKPFKDANAMRRRWEEWLLNGDREYTRTGKRKGASYEMVAQWVSEAWREMSRDIIKRSFIETGIQDCDGDEVLHSKLQSLLAGTDPSEVDDDVEDSEASDLENYTGESDSDNEKSGEESSDNDSDIDCEIIDK